MPAYKGEYEDVIRPFVDAMRHKMASSKLRGKREWQDIPLTELMSRLKAEIVELEEAIAGGNTVEMLLEAADIGNFAMMVANVAIRQAAAVVDQGATHTFKPSAYIPPELLYCPKHGKIGYAIAMAGSDKPHCPVEKCGLVVGPQ